MNSIRDRGFINRNNFLATLLKDLFIEILIKKILNKEINNVSEILARVYIIEKLIITSINNIISDILSDLNIF